jgi:hypothetical protein
MRSLVRTSWIHITRAAQTSALVVVTLTILFLTILFGMKMIDTLSVKKSELVRGYTYPLFLEKSYTNKHPVVKKFLADLSERVDIQSAPLYISREDALDERVKKDATILRAL